MRTPLFILPLCAAGIACAADYTAILLPPTPNDVGATVVTTSLNNAGQVVGYEYFPDNAIVPVKWDAGVPSRVFLPPGYKLTFGPSVFYLMSPQVPAINDAGQILIPSVDPTTGANVGLLVSGNTYTVIGPAPNDCGATNTLVFGLNASGVVVGGTAGPSCRVWWTWENGAFTILNPPHPTHFLPGGINNQGHVMGISCLNVPGNAGCESGPILDFAPGSQPVAYQDQANGISPPNNNDQVTGYVLAGPGEDNFFWENATAAPVGIPPSGRFASQSVEFTNPNDGGYLIFLPLDNKPYTIMHNGTVTGTVSGAFPMNGPLVALNNHLQSLSGPYLCSPSQ